MTDEWRDDCLAFTSESLGTLPDEELTPEFVAFVDEKIADARLHGWSAHGTKGCAKIIKNLWITQVNAR